MGKNFTIGIIVAVVLIMAVAGYFIFLNKPVLNNTNTGNSQSNSNPVLPSTTSKGPSELVLDISDLSEGYALKDRAPRVKSDVSEEGLQLGWKKGYIISFIKGENPLVGTVITQTISIYPVENISRAITPQISNENVTVETIDIEKIGDGSNAYKITEKNEFVSIEYYTVEFIKKDVYEDITIGGISKDFELLKQLAKKAASKI